jgi:GMP synthase-like glutamine amidotransferase
MTAANISAAVSVFEYASRATMESAIWKGTCMKPVAILRFTATEGPGYFATYLSEHRVPWALVSIDAGDALPPASELGGLGMMGGPMSVNDDLPWIPPVLELVRECAAAGVPVIGHCLGGQLMSKAFGGVVTRNGVKEIGWQPVTCVAGSGAEAWFGAAATFDAFHWHGETFSIPPGARRLLGSAACPNQAFELGPHLGMQCHVEMTEDLIRTWCNDWGREVAGLAARVASVQTPEEMTSDLPARVARLNELAAVVYGRWCAGLKRD